MTDGHLSGSEEPCSLREGFTTGTAATAATVAALWVLLRDENRTEVNVPLPLCELERDSRRAERLDVPISFVRTEEDGLLAVGGVIKDGGDDPDATHGAVIEAHVRLVREPGLDLDGGAGVGRVTLPGLPVAVGEAAINPGPRAQIQAAVSEVCTQCGYAGGVRVRIVVPEGERRAAHTMNARLGIVGGISILGTRGTVRPYSNSSWRAAVVQGMDVARAMGCGGVGISTGRRSEKLLMALYPEWPEQAFVQAADFVAFSLGEAAEKGFSHIAWGCFFGKLVKLAQGHAYTHAKTAPVDFAELSAWCRQGGASQRVMRAVAGANTARQVLDILGTEGLVSRVVTQIAGRAHERMEHWTRHRAHAGTRISIHVFDFDGTLLASA